VLGDPGKAEETDQAMIGLRHGRTSEHPIPSAQVGRPLASAILQQLIPDQHGFSNHTAESARPGQSSHSADQMND